MIQLTMENIVRLDTCILYSTYLYNTYDKMSDSTRRVDIVGKIKIKGT